jgi:hypothetical protein
MQVTILKSASEADVRDLTARVAAFEEITAEIGKISVKNCSPEQG